MRLAPLAATLALFLAGCATAPTPVSQAPVQDAATPASGDRKAQQARPQAMPRLTPPPDARQATAPAPPGRDASPGQPTGSALAPAWGQRYYLDDGPGDMQPTDMDRIPDAVPVEEALHRFANRPYSVFGVTYEPSKPEGTYSQRGMASWYGRRFHGKPTSSGEPYDMYKMSAAHPTLPIPSYARVTNLANGRSVVVRINDRGPFHPGRVIDLSYAAAHRLGYASRGSTEVLVEAIRPGETVEEQAASTGAPTAAPPQATASASPMPKAAQRPEGLWLQLGAFRERANAEKMRKSMAERLGEQAERLEVFEHRGSWRLGLGPLRDDANLRSTQSRVLELTGVRAIPLRP